MRGGRLPSLGESLALLPDEAEREVVARALAPDPRKRYPSCVEFVRELAKVVRGRQSVSTRLAQTFQLVAPTRKVLEPGREGDFLIVQVKRGTWTGPIQLRLEELPAGVKACKNCWIAQGREGGKLELWAEENARATDEPWPVRLVAVAGNVIQTKAISFTVTMNPKAQLRARTTIERWGGVAKADNTLPGQPVVDVRLPGPGIKDDHLAILEPLTALRTLVLWQTSITGAGLEVLKQLPRLERLSILSCTKVDPRCWKSLHLPSRLRKIELCYTKVSDELLAQLPGLTALESLDLTDSGVSDDSLRFLQALSHLKEVKLASYPVTGKGVKELQKALPGLKIIIDEPRAPEAFGR